MTKKKNQTLYMYAGLPASGKSTEARRQIAIEVDNGRKPPVRVNKDDIRAMLGSLPHSNSVESMVIAIEDAAIREALKREYNVIVDDTNLHPKHEPRLRAIADEFNVSFEVRMFTTNPRECIMRDAARSNSVGAKVILDMYRRYINPPREIEFDNSKPFAYVFDMDGTLALIHNRSPYDWTDVSGDLRSIPIVALAQTLQTDHKIIIVSGRDERAKHQTEEWLRNAGIRFDEIHMRAANNRESDDDIKEQFARDLMARYNLVVWFDDRNKVVDRIRSMGITVAQVDYGDF